MKEWVWHVPCSLCGRAETLPKLDASLLSEPAL